MGITYTWEEGLIILVICLILLFVVIIISVIKKIGIAKDYSYAVVKGGGQLFIIALFLTFLFNYEYWYFLIWLLLGSMILVSGHTAAKRATGMPKAYLVTTPSILCGATVALSVLAFSGAMRLSPQFIIPLSGMAFGNSMTICALALDRLIREVKLNKTAIETMLSLGASSKQALEKFERMSIKAALIPNIDSLKTLGIIFIPGAMSGLLIAGTDPLVAAEYQIIVYLMIIGGGIVSSLLVSTITRKKILSSHEQLEEWL